MSNVTLAEIANLCAEGFRTTIWAMRGTYKGFHVVWRAELKARAAAMYLTRLHTLTSYAEIQRFFNKRTAGAQTIDPQVERFKKFAAGDAATAEIVERIECQIDQIHNARADRLNTRKKAPAGAAEVCA